VPLRARLHRAGRIGTGYCGTERGAVYAHVMLFNDEKLYLALTDKCLFVATASVTV
jgi:hypothetical protein